MKLNMPTDLDPRLSGPRPDQAVAPQPQPMPTLAEQGVPVRKPQPQPRLPQAHRRG